MAAWLKRATSSHAANQAAIYSATLSSQGARQKVFHREKHSVKRNIRRLTPDLSWGGGQGTARPDSDVGGRLGQKKVPSSAGGA